MPLHDADRGSNEAGCDKQPREAERDGLRWETDASIARCGFESGQCAHGRAGVAGSSLVLPSVPNANVDDVPAVAQHEVQRATVIESHRQMFTD